MMFVQVKTLSVGNAHSSNLVSLINVYPTKFVSTSNTCLGKPFCINNVFQDKPTNVNILLCKPVLIDGSCHVNSSLLSQQLLFIFFLSILMFSVL